MRGVPIEGRSHFAPIQESLVQISQWGGRSLVGLFLAWVPVGVQEGQLKGTLPIGI